MAQRRQARDRPSDGDPAATRRRWSSERDAHLRQINAFSFVVPHRRKRSVTKLPAALRYAQLLPASRTVRVLLAVAVPVYAGLQLIQGATVGRALGFAVLLAIVIFAVSTYRLTVSNSGVSFDIAGLRQVSSFGFLPLFAVREVRHGVPGEWPRAKLKGGWWPGRRRVSVLYLDEEATLRAFQVWVGDPEAFGTALLGRPMSEPD
ncbi:MAG: hypothetical protein M3492_02630 [Actinomycetota bacterium]|nr:hypothetical protein [Actinomycetota bacterium]